MQHRPTILMVGQGEPMQTALGEALRRQGISVAGCATAELEQAVRVYAPDLVVLIGDAAVRGGASVVRRMAANRATDPPGEDGHSCQYWPDDSICCRDIRSSLAGSGRA